MSELDGAHGHGDGFDALSRAWQREGTDAARLRAALDRARRRMRARRYLILGLFVVVELALLFLVLVGLRFGGPAFYGIIAACAAIVPAWFSPIIRAGMGPPGGIGFRPASARHDDGQRELLRLELEAQRALMRALRLPIPILAFTLVGMLGTLTWSARAVHASAARMDMGGSPLAALFGLGLWIVLLGSAWASTWWLLRTVRRSVETLGEALGDASVHRESRRAGRLLVGQALISGVITLGLAAWPWTWWQASREWTEHLEERSGGRSAAAELLAHRVTVLDRRLESRGTAVAATGLFDAVERIRAGLAAPGRAYVEALRAPDALVGGETAPAERARVDWLVAAEEVLLAEGVGPRRLASELHRGGRSPACLRLPVGGRLEWLRHADQGARDADTELDCLLSTLVAPASPLDAVQAADAPASEGS